MDKDIFVGDDVNSDGRVVRIRSDAQTGNPLSLDNQACFCVYAALHAIKKSYRPYLDRLGVTYSQYLVLMALWAEDNLRVLDISRRLHTDSGTLTPLLKRMESLGLVLRRRRIADEREVEISLTSAGRGLREDALQMRQAVAAQLNLTDIQITALRASLKAMAAALRVGDDVEAVEQDFRSKSRRSVNREHDESVSA